MLRPHSTKPPFIGTLDLDRVTIAWHARSGFLLTRPKVAGCSNVEHATESVRFIRELRKRNGMERRPESRAPDMLRYGVHTSAICKDNNNVAQTHFSADRRPRTLSFTSHHQQYHQYQRQQQQQQPRPSQQQRWRRQHTNHAFASRRCAPLVVQHMPQHQLETQHQKQQLQQQQQPQQQVQLNKRALLTFVGVQLGSGVQLASASSLPISSPNAQVAHTRWTTFASVSIRSPLLAQN